MVSPSLVFFSRVFENPSMGAVVVSLVRIPASTRTSIFRTIAFQAHPSATEERLDAIDAAIATWSTTLEDCFDGLITLRNVTGSKRQDADIVVHFAPTAGEVVFGDMRSVATTEARTSPLALTCPQASTVNPTTPSMSDGVALHEIGQARGLGHAANLLESTDLNGLRWPDLADPVLSDCDIAALAFILPGRSGARNLQPRPKVPTTVSSTERIGEGRRQFDLGADP